MRYRVVIILCVLAATACSTETASNVSSGTRQQVLHMGNADEPQDLDPHTVTGLPEHRIISALLEGLVGKDPADLSPIPAVATSWELSDDGKTWVFHIRETARWSNGDRLTAHDFVWSWQRALTAELGNQYAYMLYPLVNAERYHKGQIDNFSQVGVRAIDDLTLQVNLSGPTPYFPELLDHYSTFPVHRATIEKYGNMHSRGTTWTRAGNFTGNGPFNLVRWEQNRIVVVEKNPLYWDAESVRLQAIHFHPVQQTTTEERMFRTGQLHVTTGIPEEKIAAYMQENTDTVRQHPYLGTYFYRFNTTRPPLDNALVRRALAMSIDRRAIVEKITKGGQMPAFTLTPPDTRGYTAPATVSFDTRRAAELLAAAGYPDGRGFPGLQLLYNTSESHRKVALAIQQMWKQALNIDITLHNQDWKVYLDNERTMNYEISRAAWIGDYVDPNTFLDMFVTGGGNNRTGWSNRTYDDLIAGAAKTADQRQRYELFRQAETILMEEMPIAPIYTYSRIHLVSPDVHGWYENILAHQLYKRIYLETVDTD